MEPILTPQNREDIHQWLVDAKKTTDRLTEVVRKILLRLDELDW